MGLKDYYDSLDFFDDPDSTITQIRIHEASTNNFEYLTNIGASEEFLRNNVGKKIDMAILFVDLVGSTQLSMVLPERTLAILMTSFSHEMAYLIEESNGYVLKFVGDAVIGYFVGNDSVNRAAQCAIGMLYKTKYALHEMFSGLTRNEQDKIIDAAELGTVTDEQIKLLESMVDFQKFAVKIGLNYGKNIVVRYGRASQEISPVDLIGYPLNITAKMQSYARPHQMLIGERLYDKLSASDQAEFVDWSHKDWRYYHPGTDNMHKLYSFDKFVDNK